MNISKKHLDKFKALYKKRFNEELSDQDALEKATKLITMVKAVYKPMTKKEYEMVQKRREELRNN